jgi:hypothetical protein
MPFNTLGWNRVRYTLLAPLYDRVAGFRPQRWRSIFPPLRGRPSSVEASAPVMPARSFGRRQVTSHQQVTE